LIDKIAALIPPPRAHRHRYYGVLAPNSPMRAAVTALAPMPVIVPPLVEATEADAPPQRAASHYLWAMLLARIYETLPLVCPNCHAPMRIIAFITDAGAVREAAMASERAGNDSQWDSAAQPEPVFEFDQRVAW